MIRSAKSPLSSFLTGFGRVLDLGGVSERRSTFGSRPSDIASAMRGDWSRIGDDMRDAVETTGRQIVTDQRPATTRSN